MPLLTMLSINAQLFPFAMITPCATALISASGTSVGVRKHTCLPTQTHNFRAQNVEEKVATKKCDYTERERLKLSSHASMLFV